MKKSIMISIQPQWVEKILNGEKTIEIRKTMPKCSLPCKVYIYCTQGKRKLVEVLRKGEIKWFGKDENDRYEENTFITIPHYNYGDKRHNMLGKVVAEFTLNKVTKHDKNFIDCEDNICYNFKVCDVKNAGFETDCLSLIDFDNFVEDYGKGKPLYAWHIDNLKIYDKPKELSEFRKDLDCDDYPCNKGGKNSDCKYCYYDISEGCQACGIDFDGEHCIYKTIKRPPQSWCYVEKIKC